MIGCSLHQGNLGYSQDKKFQITCTPHLQVMEHYFNEMDQINLVERLIRRERIVRDRANTFLNYSEEEFIDKFR